MILIRIPKAQLIGSQHFQAGVVPWDDDEEAYNLIASRRVEAAQQLTPQQIGYINALTDSYHVRRTGKHPRFEDFATQE